jgi:hypothetical protein
VSVRKAFNSSSGRGSSRSQSIYAGRFSVFTEYASNAPTSGAPEHLWTGRLRSNTVEFEYIEAPAGR